MCMKDDRLVVVGMCFGGRLESSSIVSGMKNMVVGIFCSSVGRIIVI